MSTTQSKGVIETLPNGILDFPMTDVLAAVRERGGNLIYADDSRQTRDGVTLWTLVFHDAGAVGTEYEYFRLQQTPGPFGPSFRFLRETAATVADNYGPITTVRPGEYAGYACYTASGFQKYSALKRADVDAYMARHNAAIERAKTL